MWAQTAQIRYIPARQESDSELFWPGGLEARFIEDIEEEEQEQDQEEDEEDEEDDEEGDEEEDEEEEEVEKEQPNGSKDRKRDRDPDVHDKNNSGGSNQSGSNHSNSTDTNNDQAGGSKHPPKKRTRIIFTPPRSIGAQNCPSESSYFVANILSVIMQIEVRDFSSFQANRIIMRAIAND